MMFHVKHSFAFSITYDCVINSLVENGFFRLGRAFRDTVNRTFPHKLKGYIDFYLFHGTRNLHI